MKLSRALGSPAIRADVGKWSVFISLATPVLSWRIGRVYDHGHQFCYDLGPLVVFGVNYLNEA